MDRPDSAARDLASAPQGWLVEVDIIIVGGGQKTELFAVAEREASEAVARTRAYIGGLHGAIGAKVALSERALRNLNVEPGTIRHLSH
jgi:hypothetical protein